MNAFHAATACYADMIHAHRMGYHATARELAESLVVSFQRDGESPDGVSRHVAWGRCNRVIRAALACSATQDDGFDADLVYETDPIY